MRSGLALAELERCLRILEKRFGQPEFLEDRNHSRFRYKETDLELACILKMARVISSLNASLLLLPHGFVQEIGTLCRTIQEAHQGIFFLLEEHTDVKISDDQQQYLVDFFQEEYIDLANTAKGSKSRKRVPQQKIVASIGRQLSGIAEVSAQNARLRLLNDGLSGFIHYAYPHIMEMYGGRKSGPRFHLSGVPARIREYADELTHHVDRSFMMLGLVAIRLKEESVLKRILAAQNRYCAECGYSLKEEIAALKNNPPRKKKRGAVAHLGEWKGAVNGRPGSGLAIAHLLSAGIGRHLVCNDVLTQMVVLG